MNNAPNLRAYLNLFHFVHLVVDRTIMMNSADTTT